MMRRHCAAIVVAVDMAVLSVFYWMMPSLRRPFEILMVVLSVLAVATAVFVGRPGVRALCMIVASLAIALFSVEMAQKVFNIMEVTRPTAKPITAGAGGKYSWNSDDPATYLTAKQRARADGVTPEALVDRFTGDYFAGVDRASIRVLRDVSRHGVIVVEGLEALYHPEARLGYGLNPGAVARCYSMVRETGEFVTDALYRIDANGARETRGSGDSGDAYVFLGCSFTFGQYLQDDETLPHYFSEFGDFRDKVANLGTSGWGPAHVLMDLESDYRLTKELGSRPTVRGVVFSLIDDHVHRVATARLRAGPNYLLRDGRPVYARTVYSEADDSFLGRMATMMEKSRVYPTLRDRVFHQVRSGGEGYGWDLLIAILKEIDGICRQRYGVPLLVVYWDDTPEVVGMLRDAGLDTVRVGEAFEEGEDWRRMAIKYQVYDLHPSAYANRKIAELLRYRFADKQTARQKQKTAFQ